MTLSALPLALEVNDNMDFGELVVGVGTLVLAGITGLLAWKTSASVAMAEVSAEAARESARAERDSVEAVAMPYVIAVPRAVGAEILFVPSHTFELGGTLKLCLWNLGSGPGIVTNMSLVCCERELLAALPRGIPLGAGNQLNVGADVIRWPKSPDTATLEIEYLHSNGRAYRTESAVRIMGEGLTCLTFRRSLAKEAGGD